MRTSWGSVLITPGILPNKIYVDEQVLGFSSHYPWYTSSVDEYPRPAAGVQFSLPLVYFSAAQKGPFYWGYLVISH